MALRKDVIVWRLFIVASGLLLLAGCVGSRTPASEGAAVSPLPANYGRYSINQDRAPSVPLDPSQIQDVVPVPLSRTMAGNRSPYRVNGKSYSVMTTEEGYRETGLASWYGEKFHGHRTSNGEVFDMYQLSAAHKSLPIPSYLRVTNLDNNKSTIVRVNDRGPFHSERLIDLSYAAAWKLGFADRGTARVMVEAIIPGLYNQDPAQDLTGGRLLASTASGGQRYLQVGAFADETAARQLTDRIQRITSEPVFIQTVQTDSAQLHRVRIGPIADPADIDRITALVVDADLGSPYTVEE